MIGDVVVMVGAATIESASTCVAAVSPAASFNVIVTLPEYVAVGRARDLARRRADRHAGRQTGSRPRVRATATVPYDDVAVYGWFDLSIAGSDVGSGDRQRCNRP